MEKEGLIYMKRGGLMPLDIAVADYSSLRSALGFGLEGGGC